MIDTFTAFIAGIATGYILTWPGLIVLFILGTYFEHRESRGTAVFIGILTIFTSYFFFDVSVQTIAEYAVGYLAVGILWSFWRYKKYVTAKVKYIKEYERDDMQHYYAKNLHPSKHLDTITAWILIWPFSMMESVVGDAIDMVNSLVTNVFKSVYHKIYAKAIQDLNLPE